MRVYTKKTAMSFNQTYIFQTPYTIQVVIDTGDILRLLLEPFCLFKAIKDTGHKKWFVQFLEGFEHHEMSSELFTNLNCMQQCVRNY